MADGKNKGYLRPFFSHRDMEFMTVLFANESDEKFPVNCNGHYWPKSRASKLK